MFRANNEGKALIDDKFKKLLTYMDLDSKWEALMNRKFHFPLVACMDFNVAKFQHLKRFGDMVKLVE